ncbi:hypothetical protein ASG01_09005 [Chryseobacterium sp. Leaf180]|uniref:hypothetical protein n=1 Tax=Chryseobacterium sp. Leaf180 TaxID=1736289 RepID=UPI0006FDD10F|nr:hypothetical protein [Chryseobacterium sp. Leaf180]KQR93325.1 hypothetical protein ASG01_09005 [Chryseobacterium sp. Leaf180]
MNITQRTISEYEAWTALMYGIAGCTPDIVRKGYKNDYIKRVYFRNIKFLGVDFNQLFYVVQTEWNRLGESKFLAQYIPYIPEDEKEIIYCHAANMAFTGGELDRHEVVYLRLLAQGLNLTPDFVQNVNRIFEITHRGNTV